MKKNLNCTSRFVRSRRALCLGSALAAAALTTACSTSPPLAVTEPAGPGKPAVASAQGALQVFSATETRPEGDNTYYYPHSSYSVLDPAGHQVKFVRNHVGSMDETPSVVLMPAGNYTILAEAEGYGRVRIPIVIQARRTTVVHLERDWKPADANSGELVRLPDGQPIGWRSQPLTPTPAVGKARPS